MIHSNFLRCITTMGLVLRFFGSLRSRRAFIRSTPVAVVLCTFQSVSSPCVDVSALRWNFAALPVGLDRFWTGCRWDPRFFREHSRIQENNVSCCRRKKVLSRPGKWFSGFGVFFYYFGKMHKHIFSLVGDISTSLTVIKNSERLIFRVLSRVFQLRTNLCSNPV